MGRRRTLLIAAGLVVAFGAWRSIAIAGYRAQGKALVAQADRFPRKYSVGAGRSMGLIVLGDSTAAGVGVERYEQTLPYLIAAGQGCQVAVHNLAVSGARAIDVVRSQLDRLPAQGADVALVSISANDATHGTSPSDMQESLRTILKRLQTLGVKKIVVSTTPNFRTTPALPLLLNHLFENRAAELTDRIREAVAQYPSVRIADINREGTLNDEQYAADGFHPNAAGYRLWASIFLRALEP